MQTDWLELVDWKGVGKGIGLGVMAQMVSFGAECVWISRCLGSSVIVH